MTEKSRSKERATKPKAEEISELRARMGAAREKLSELAKRGKAEAQERFKLLETLDQQLEKVEGDLKTKKKAKELRESLGSVDKSLKDLLAEIQQLEESEKTSPEDEDLGGLDLDTPDEVADALLGGGSTSGDEINLDELELEAPDREQKKNNEPVKKTTKVEPTPPVPAEPDKNELELDLPLEPEPDTTTDITPPASDAAPPAPSPVEQARVAVAEIAGKIVDIPPADLLEFIGRTRLQKAMDGFLSGGSESDIKEELKGFFYASASREAKKKLDARLERWGLTFDEFVLRWKSDLHEQVYLALSGMVGAAIEREIMSDPELQKFDQGPMDWKSRVARAVRLALPAVIVGGAAFLAVSNPVIGFGVGAYAGAAAAGGFGAVMRRISKRLNFLKTEKEKEAEKYQEERGEMVVAARERVRENLKEDLVNDKGARMMVSFVSNLLRKKTAIPGGDAQVNSKLLFADAQKRWAGELALTGEKKEVIEAKLEALVADMQATNALIDSPHVPDKVKESKWWNDFLDEMKTAVKKGGKMGDLWVNDENWQKRVLGHALAATGGATMGAAVGGISYLSGTGALGFVGRSLGRAGAGFVIGAAEQGLKETDLVSGGVEKKEVAWKKLEAIVDDVEHALYKLGQGTKVEEKEKEKGEDYLKNKFELLQGALSSGILGSSEDERGKREIKVRREALRERVEAAVHEIRRSMVENKGMTLERLFSDLEAQNKDKKKREKKLIEHLLEKEKDEAKGMRILKTAGKRAWHAVAFGAAFESVREIFGWAVSDDKKPAVGGESNRTIDGTKKAVAGVAAGKVAEETLARTASKHETPRMNLEKLLEQSKPRLLVRDGEGLSSSAMRDFLTDKDVRDGYMAKVRGLEKIVDEKRLDRIWNILQEKHGGAITKETKNSLSESDETYLEKIAGLINKQSKFGKILVSEADQVMTVFNHETGKHIPVALDGNGKPIFDEEALKQYLYRQEAVRGEAGKHPKFNYDLKEYFAQVEPAKAGSAFSSTFEVHPSFTAEADGIEVKGLTLAPDGSYAPMKDAFVATFDKNHLPDHITGHIPFTPASGGGGGGGYTVGILSSNRPDGYAAYFGDNMLAGLKLSPDGKFLELGDNAKYVSYDPADWQKAAGEGGIPVVSERVPVGNVDDISFFKNDDELAAALQKGSAGEKAPVGPQKIEAPEVRVDQSNTSTAPDTINPATVEAKLLEQVLAHLRDKTHLKLQGMSEVERDLFASGLENKTITALTPEQKILADNTPLPKGDVAVDGEGSHALKYFGGKGRAYFLYDENQLFREAKDGGFEIKKGDRPWEAGRIAEEKGKIRVE